MKPTLLILAAGIGSRYGGLKQADSVGPSGEAIIEYSIYDAIRAGFGKVVIVIRKSIEQDFKDKFSGKFDDKIKVEFAFQELDSPIKGIKKFPEGRTKPWGTGHAMLVAAHLVKEPFLVINADDFYGFSAFKQMSEFLTESCTAKQCGMVGYWLKNTLSENGHVSRGVCTTDKNNHLTSVVERTKIIRDVDNDIYFFENDTKIPLAEDTIVSMNFWGFHPSVFEMTRKMFVEFVKNNFDQPTAEFYIPKVANNYVETGKADLTVMTTRDQWYGVTYKEDKQTVQEAFNALTTIGVYPKGLWKHSEELVHA
ncbi:MAG: sugar phosphate nucleotidyltransferase [Saprospiraceae bacterium]|nr:sugar phosphate nucleotidyltransferase [Saprospiraceae bacterium]